MKRKNSDTGLALPVLLAMYCLMAWGAASICVLAGVLDQDGFFTAVCFCGLSIMTGCSVRLYAKLLVLQDQVARLERRLNWNDESTI